MKRIVICGILAAVIFLSGILGLIYTVSVCDNILEYLGQVRESIEAGDSEKALTAANEAAESWQRFRKVHIFITDNGHALEVAMTAQRIEELLMQEDDEAIVECGVMEELIRCYCDEQKVNFGNIF